LRKRRSGEEHDDGPSWSDLAVLVVVAVMVVVVVGSKGLKRKSRTSS